MGNQLIAQAAKDAGAKIMFGYPITPSSEILETWAKFCLKDSSLKILQTEDEAAAGFGVVGACLAGQIAFTATAGPGNILMQDAMSMAEAQRIPTVCIITQRGGLSTSTVIYSQEEVILTCFGGNGEGFRIVYSTSSLADLYTYTQKAFQVAWQYRWPTFVLADGYQGKMFANVNIKNKNANINNTPILKKGVNLRNCYNLEEEINQVIEDYKQAYSRDRNQIEEHREYLINDSDYAIIAHGIVAAACLPAIDQLRKKGLKIGLFQPITLRPYPKIAGQKLLKDKKRLLVIESALGQLARLHKDELSDLNIPITEIFKPAMGFTPEEIYERISAIS